MVVGLFFLLTRQTPHDRTTCSKALGTIPISSKTEGVGNAPAKIRRPFSSIDSICLRTVLGFRVVEGYSKDRRMKSAACFRIDSDNFASFTTLAIVSAPIMVVAAAMARFFA
jgi:hypothetical protein